MPHCQKHSVARIEVWVLIRLFKPDQNLLDRPWTQHITWTKLDRGWCRGIPMADLLVLNKSHVKTWYWSQVRLRRLQIWCFFLACPSILCIRTEGKWELNDYFNRRLRVYLNINIENNSYRYFFILADCSHRMLWVNNLEVNWSFFVCWLQLRPISAADSVPGRMVPKRAGLVHMARADYLFIRIIWVSLLDLDLVLNGTKEMIHQVSLPSSSGSSRCVRMNWLTLRGRYLSNWVWAGMAPGWGQRLQLCETKCLKRGFG